MSATRGTLNEVRDSGGERSRGAELFDHPDRRQAAKASNDVVAEEDGGEGVFARAGMAAE